MTSSVSSPAVRLPEPFALRVLHFLLSFGLAVTVLFLITLGLLSASETLREIFHGFFSNGSSSFALSPNTQRTVNAVILGAIGVVLIVPFLIAWRMKLRSWRLLLILPMGAVSLGTWWFLFQYLGDERITSGKLLETVVRWSLLLIILPATLLLARRLQKRPWWWVGGGYLAVAPVLTYLVVDDATLRHSTTIEEIAPAFPGAEKSYEVLMRYGKNHPLGRDFRGPQRIWQTVGKPLVTFDPKQAEVWREWLLARRSEIEADWADLAPVRAWWSELNTFDRLGDLTTMRWDAEIMTFQAPRSYSQLAVAIASLQALDGNGDAAFETLLPILEVSRKLEPSARTLVRFMIARVIQKLAIDTAGFVLDQTPVSAANRARFAAALTGGSGGEAGARRLVGIEYSFALENPNYYGVPATRYDPQPEGRSIFRVAAIRGFNSFISLVYNPNKTLNLYGDYTERLQDLAARRELDKIGPMANAFFKNEGRPRFKNVGGTVLMLQMMPAYSKVLEAYWKTEDARTALRERLSKM